MAETNEQRLAREKAEDEAAAKEFMGNGPGIYKREVPTTQEDANELRNKEAYEAHEADLATQRAIRQNQVAEARKYMNNADDTSVRKTESLQLLPGPIKEWAIQRVRQRQAGRTDDEAIATAKRFSDNARMYAGRDELNKRSREAMQPGIAKDFLDWKDRAVAPTAKPAAADTGGLDGYIDRVRQALKNAASAKPAEAPSPAPQPRSAEVQSPKSMVRSSDAQDPGMTGPRAVQRNRVRWADSSLSPSGGYERQERKESAEEREVRLLKKSEQ